MELVSFVEYPIVAIAYRAIELVNGLADSKISEGFGFFVEAEFWQNGLLKFH